MLLVNLKDEPRAFSFLFLFILLKLINRKRKKHCLLRKKQGLLPGVIFSKRFKLVQILNKFTGKKFTFFVFMI
jgi:hypothetical protein